MQEVRPSAIHPRTVSMLLDAKGTIGQTIFTYQLAHEAVIDSSPFMGGPGIRRLAQIAIGV